MKLFFSVFSLSLFLSLNALQAQETPKGPREVVPHPFRSNLSAQPAPKELQSNFDSFFAFLIEGKAEKAFEALVKNQPLAENLEGMKSMSDVTQQALAAYGKATSAELVDNHLVGTRLCSLTFISTHKRSPIRWRVICFKPESSWVIVDIVFDDGFKGWFN